MANAPVRDRLLATADRLFYEEGTQAVGIDRILAEAGAAKASLYAHFGSKDELVAAYIGRRAEAAREAILAFAASLPPEERAQRFFDWVVEWVESPSFRGCPMQRVANELPTESHPGHAKVVEQRAWIAARMLEWVRAANLPDATQTAAALVVLFDGAVAASEADGPQRARDARWAARRLLDGGRRAAR
jgi:AcrR family transcriptional regulator